MNLDDFLSYIKDKESNYSLILGDTDQIHAYVFETSKLPEIRGASQLLRTLITKKFNKIFNDHLTNASTLDKIENDANIGYKIYNDAGSCMAIVPTDKAEEFINIITETDVGKGLQLCNALLNSNLIESINIKRKKFQKLAHISCVFNGHIKKFLAIFQPIW